jgi:hypothetical protein
MTLQRPKNSAGQFEQPTDPALVASNGVGPTSMWLDTSTTPAILKERNASNTGWNNVNLLLSNSNPESLGTVGSGLSDYASRSDHVHPMPTYADVGATPALGRHTETFTATAGQTTRVLTYTPPSIADITMDIDGWIQDNDNITDLSGKTITFEALTLGMDVTLTYTRLD